MESIVPEEVGFSSTRLRRIHTVMQRYVDQRALAGLVTLIVRHGHVAHSACYGMMDVAAQMPMQPDTIFRIASMVKPITAVAVLMLYEQGYLQLDDPIAEYIPEFADTKVFAASTAFDLELADLQRPVTIRHLLAHTSGIGLGVADKPPIEAMYRDAVADLMGTPGMTLQTAVRELAKVPLAHQPGTAWRYSLSFEVLACLVEVVSGQWFDVFVKQRIFEPLDMVDTAYVVPQDHAGRLAALYRYKEGGGYELMESPAESPHVKFAGYESGTVWTTGGDGMLSTPHDYARFAYMLLNRGACKEVRLLSPKTVELMTANHLPAQLLPYDAERPGYGHGLGVQVLMDVAQSGVLGSAGEFTGGGGHGTYFWVDPKEDLIGLLMLQLSQNPYPIHRQFKVLAYQALTEGV